MALHAQMKYVGKHPLITVLDITAPLHSSNPSQVLINERIDLAEFGLVTASALQYMSVLIEKEVGGQWVPTEGEPNWDIAEVPPSMRPAEDPEGYTVTAVFCADDMDTSPAVLLAADAAAWEAFTRGQHLGMDPWFLATVGVQVNTDRTHQVSRLRVMAVADCSSGTHDAKGYRIRMRVRVPDYSVWSMEVAIPAAENTLFLDPPLIDLRDLGLTTNPAEFAVVALFRRNGKTIRMLDLRQSLTGETFDPPAYPVHLVAKVIEPDTQVWQEQNGNNGFPGMQYCSDFSAALPVASGAWLAADLANCTEWINHKVKLMAWREGAALTEYVPSNGAAPVAVPVGSADGCTLLLKLFRAPQYRYGEYPFVPSRTFTRTWLSTPPLAQPETTRYVLASENSALSREPFGRLLAGGLPLAMVSDLTGWMFVSAEFVGSGVPQDVPHGLFVVPAKVQVTPVKWPAGSACEFTATADATNVNVTMTLGVTYIVMAWRPL